MKKTSLKDIARELGVSIALVSYVLNGKRLNRVSGELADRIRSKAAELHYQADPIARSLKTRKTFTIGVLVPDITNPFFARLAGAIQAEAGRCGYAVLMGSAGEDRSVFSEILHRLLERSIDGLILGPVADSIGLIGPLQDAGFPVVLVDRFFPEMSLSAVSVDHYRAAFQAVTHLIDQGCRTISMLSYESALFLIHERERGFRDALAAGGLEFRPQQLQRIDYHRVSDTIGPAMDDLLDSAPDGIFFVANMAATAGIQHLNQRRIRIPDQVAVISFDENEASALFYAPISFMRQPIAEIAAESVRLVLAPAGSPRQVLLPAELVVQASSQFGQRQTGG